MTYSLLTDGNTDEVLVPILDWSLQACGVKLVRAQFVDKSRIPLMRMPDLILQIPQYYPCDVVFLHRDSENADPDDRRAEISRKASGLALPNVPVIPVRMTEAWLLIDDTAIRRAAGNPNGKVALPLPRVSQLESIPDRKATLYAALRTASELNRRRLARFRPDQAARRVAEYTNDFSPLMALPAFQRLQTDIQAMLPRLAVSSE